MSDSVSQFELVPGRRYRVSAQADGILVGRGAPDDNGDSLTVPGSALAQLGCRLVTPHDMPALGLWLRAQLDSDNSAGVWSLGAEDGSWFEAELLPGVVTLQRCDAPLAADSARFRHDARSLLNAVGMNADLIGMQATNGEWQSIADAAARIRSSCNSLSTLVTDYTATRDDQTVGSLVESLQFLLARGGIEIAVTPNSADVSMPVAFCVAVARLFSEWCATVGAGEHFRLCLAPDQVRLEVACGTAIVMSGAGCFSYAECGAAPALAGFSPATMLRGMGAGCGAWQARGSASICAGIPKR